MVSAPFGKTAAGAGLVFAVLFIAGVIMASSGSAETNDEYIRYFQDSGNQTKAVLAFYTLVVSAISFLVFVVGIRSRLVAQSKSADSLDMLVVVFGLVVALAIVVGGAAIAAISGDAKFSGGGSSMPQDGGVLQAFESMGFGLLFLAAAIPGAACAAVVSFAAFKQGAFPRWLGILGLVCAFSLLFAVVLPPIGLPIWVVATSVVLWRSQPS